MIFQDYKLLEDRTVYENVALPLQIAGFKSRLIKDKTYSLLDKVALTNKASKFPSKLSGGERQRVAIARALVKDPLLILADEPTGNLDSETSIEIMRLFQEIHKKGNTIILVTHEDEIAKHAHRIIRLFDGKITEDIEQSL